MGTKGTNFGQKGQKGNNCEQIGDKKHEIATFSPLAEAKNTYDFNQYIRELSKNVFTVQQRKKHISLVTICSVAKF